MDAAAQAPGQLAGVQLLAWRRCGDERCDGGFVGGAGCYPGEGEFFAGQGCGGGLPAQQGAVSPGGAAGAQDGQAVDEPQAAESAGVCAQAPGARMQGQMSGCRIHE